MPEPKRRALSEDGGSWEGSEEGSRRILDSGSDGSSRRILSSDDDDESRRVLDSDSEGSGGSRRLKNHE